MGKLNKLRPYVNKMIISTFISSIIFFMLGNTIDTIRYFICISIVYFLIFINFSIKKSLDMYKSLISIIIGNIISFVIIKKYFSSNYDLSLIDNIVLGILVAITISALVAICVLYINRDEDTDNRKLMPKREADLERLLKYLNTFNIVSINSKWGDGKSFLVNQLKKRVADEYEIIEIDILSCNLNELQLILINEIEKIMYKNRILSKYSKKLKDFLSKEVSFQKVWSISFSENFSYSEIIKGFGVELNKLSKKILIIYEDIDRISDEKIIKNIFALSEKLSGKNIKILYQYDEKNLEKIGFKDNYLEKYMPYKMNLTEMNFFEILKFKLNESNIDEEILSLNDFDFLKEYNQISRFIILRDKFNFNELTISKLNNFSIRKIEHFIGEISIALNDYVYSRAKETVIGLFFVKHFLIEIYRQFNVQFSVLDTIKFKFEEDEYTILELISMYNSHLLDENQVEKIVNNYQNQLNYFVLRIFNYNIQETMDSDSDEERLRLINNEPIENFKERIENEEKDRVIWNLLESGKSKYTNYENQSNKLINFVLLRDEDERVSAFKEFRKYMFHLDSDEVDNETTQLFGVSWFIELFKGFNLKEVSEENRIRLIDLYFEVENIREISVEFIETMNYCPLITKSEYIHILGKFNKLEVVGNLNSEESFLNFLKKYIRALSHSKIAYCNTYDYSYTLTRDTIKGNEKIILRELEMLIFNINDMKNNISSKLNIKQLENELETIIIFAKKLIQIIQFKTPYNYERGLKIKTNSKLININQSEYDRLKVILETENSNIVNDEVNRSYLDGKITLYEIDKLIKSDMK
ncbi:hypothetical protein CDLVIII_3205 [Clostridium sp. DL-VIII]|uniref:hypothetical protein n=1 Tax=Clostridium sp. DL-VIII TaxID=641107 RepID=UPI00023AFFD2|nr:hypothetical protein [Clostridium sp. DL-VIII]EHI99779.1 hypothetical protein CDLVIII_3205 [Clostridium sp. DL-VIII]